MPLMIAEGSLREPCPVKVDTETELGDAFCFRDWVAQHRQQIDGQGKMAVFDTSTHQLQASIFLIPQIFTCARE